MKTTKRDLDLLNRRLSAENDVLTLALSDLCNGAVKWFGNSRTYSIGLSRPTGAAGGIAIVRQSGTTSAHYWEDYSRETLARIADLVTGADTEHNRELLRERATIETAQAYVSESQRAA